MRACAAIVSAFALLMLRNNARSALRFFAERKDALFTDTTAWKGVFILWKGKKKKGSQEPVMNMKFSEGKNRRQNVRNTKLKLNGERKRLFVFFGHSFALSLPPSSCEATFLPSWW